MKLFFKKNNKKFVDSSFNKDETITLYPFNPEVILAGRLPYTEKNSDSLQKNEIVWHALSQTLDTNNVRFVTQVSGSSIYYLGAKESEFDGTGIFSTRLGDALPGASNHQGDAAYFDLSAATPAVLFIENECVSVRTGSQESLERIAKQKNLRIVNLDESATKRWESVPSLSAKASFIRLKRSTNIGIISFLAFTVISALSLLIIATSNGAEKSAVQASDVLKKQLIVEIERASSSLLNSQLKQLQVVQMTAMANNGVINYWKIDTKGIVSFKLTLPAYVHAAAYKSVEPITSAEIVNDKLVITRGPKNEKN